MKLLLFSENNGQEQFLAEIAVGPVLIGRNVDRCQIILDSSVVSTIHGEFFLYAGQWFFKDLGSSNGSSINQQKLKSDQPYFLREGDILTLANMTLIVRYEEQRDSMRRMAFVFQQWDPISAIQIPEYGKALELGGKSKQFEISGEFSNTALVLIESTGQAVTLTARASGFPVYLNQRAFHGTSILKDRDLIEVVDYSILVDCSEDHASSGVGAFSKLQTWTDDAQKEIDAYESKAHMTKGKRFGRDSAVRETDLEDDSASVIGAPERKAPPVGGVLSAAKPKVDQDRLLQIMLVISVLLSLIAVALYFTL